MFYIFTKNHNETRKQEEIVHDVISIVFFFYMLLLWSYGVYVCQRLEQHSICSPQGMFLITFFAVYVQCEIIFQVLIKPAGMTVCTDYCLDYSLVLAAICVALEHSIALLKKNKKCNNTNWLTMHFVLYSSHDISSINYIVSG